MEGSGSGGSSELLYKDIEILSISVKLCGIIDWSAKFYSDLNVRIRRCSLVRDILWSTTTKRIFFSFIFFFFVDWISTYLFLACECAIIVYVTRSANVDNWINIEKKKKKLLLKQRTQKGMHSCYVTKLRLQIGKRILSVRRRICTHIYIRIHTYIDRHRAWSRVHTNVHRYIDTVHSRGKFRSFLKMNYTRVLYLSLRKGYINRNEEKK